MPPSSAYEQPDRYNLRVIHTHFKHRRQVCSMSTTDWVFERNRLAILMQDHPDWPASLLAAACGHSLSWAKRWRRKILNHITEQGPLSTVLQGGSRAPLSRPKILLSSVRDAVLSFRDQLREVYNRLPGPKTLLYHLHRDPVLRQQVQELGGYLPQSTRTIWQILKDGGRLPQRVKDHHPLVRAEPMTLWEMDFGQMGQAFEFLVFADQGTSIQVDTHALAHYNAETALLATAQTLLVNGLPERISCDNDPRLVSSWRVDGYPSPFMRFLLCLGVTPHPLPPGRPDLKPIVERMIRTTKHECLWPQRPATAAQAEPILREKRRFYNYERPNQSVVCQNRPPYEAFPNLPDRPDVPEMIDPDQWLEHYNGFCFKRQVSAQGVVSIDRQRYTVGMAYAGQRVQLRVNAPQQCFELVVKGKTVCDIPIKGLCGVRMSFQDYLKMMVEEARSLDRLRAIKKKMIKRAKPTR